MLFWLIVSAFIQGFGPIIKVFAFASFFGSIDIILSVIFNLPSFFSLSRIYALGAIIVLCLFFVVIEAYYPSFTKMFVMITTAFTGALIAISVVVYAEDNSFFPLSRDFIREHFTYSVIAVWLALGLFGLFVQYKESKAAPSERIKWEDNWPDY